MLLSRAAGRACQRVTPILCVFAFAAVAFAQESASPSAGPMIEPSRPATQAPAPVEQEPPPAQRDPKDQLPPPARFDKAIFQKTYTPDQLSFLGQYAGAQTGDLYHDKQFRKLMHDALPNWMYHWGRDMPVLDALGTVLDGSRLAVQLRDGRFLTASGEGRASTGMPGRGMVWVDMHDGLVLAAFYFRPSNGEPTPTLTIFTKQIKVDEITMGQLPPAFAQDLAQWTLDERIPIITTRYFIGGVQQRILLEHDEDYCLSADGSTLPPDSGCDQRNADAADTDMTGASYLEQVHYATNATAWMINGPEQVAFVEMRARTCVGANALGCQIRLTRERTHTILHRGRR